MHNQRLVPELGPELPVTGTLFPEDNLDEPRDNQESGFVGMGSEWGSQRNWMLRNTTKPSMVHHSQSKAGLAKGFRNM